VHLRLQVLRREIHGAAAADCKRDFKLSGASPDLSGGAAG